MFSRGNEIIMSWSRDLMSWARDLMSWERDLMSWERDNYVVGTRKIFFFTCPLSAAVVPYTTFQKNNRNIQKTRPPPPHQKTHIHTPTFSRKYYFSSLEISYYFPETADKSPSFYKLVFTPYGRQGNQTSARSCFKRK